MRELAVAIQNDNKKVNVIETINSIKKAGFNILFAHLGYQNINAIWEEGKEGDDLVERYKTNIRDCKENGISMVVMHLTSHKKAPMYNEIGYEKGLQLAEMIE